MPLFLHRLTILSIVALISFIFTLLLGQLKNAPCFYAIGAIYGRCSTLNSHQKDASFGCLFADKRLLGSCQFRHCMVILCQNEFFVNNFCLFAILFHIFFICSCEVDHMIFINNFNNSVCNSFNYLLVVC